MDIVALEVGLEEDHETITHCPIGEVVDEQVEAHPRANPEDCRQAEGHRVASIEYHLFGLALGPAVDGNRLERRLLRAGALALAQTVAGVGIGIEHLLVGLAELEQQLDCTNIGAAGRLRLPRT